MKFSAYCCKETDNILRLLKNGDKIGLSQLELVL
jgi:hypothetical protein